MDRHKIDEPLVGTSPCLDPALFVYLPIQTLQHCAPDCLAPSLCHTSVPSLLPAP